MPLQRKLGFLTRGLQPEIIENIFPLTLEDCLETDSLFAQVRDLAVRNEDRPTGMSRYVPMYNSCMGDQREIARREG